MSSGERAIRELIENWMAASRAGDTAAVLKLMADDVIFKPKGVGPCRASIPSMLRQR